MSRSSEYSTRQKDKLFDVIKKHNKEFTVKDIYNELGDEIGLTTIYRFVDKLSNIGVLRKSLGKDNVTYYQYLEHCDNENHFYLKCDLCGEMEHIDCECIGELFNHILNKHKFMPSRDHIIINGICRKCGNKHEKK